MTTSEFISIIIPCRNEERFIGQCLDSVIANNYPKDGLEILVVDGMSQDGTRRIVAAYAERYPFIRLIENPKNITPVGLNIGIARAKGDIIIWMSAHNRYENSYISRSVESLHKYAADNVGGVIIALPREESLIGRAIVTCLSNRFGVGNSYFRVHPSEPKWVDTVFGGCYRRDVFSRVGLFNENLVRGQDLEFNLRLKKAGGRTLLLPSIVSYYYARSDMKSFLKHNWINGVWAILPFLYSDIMPVSWRHLVPLVFVLGLFGSAGLALVWPFGLWAFVAIGGAYAGLNLAASAQVAVREKDFRDLFVMPAVFAALHIVYGLGSLWGLVRAMISRELWRDRLPRWWRHEKKVPAR
jgi:glycosyltransferase involved in cell wall biosynthesis